MEIRSNFILYEQYFLNIKYKNNKYSNIYFLFLFAGEEDSELEESQETTSKEIDFKVNIAPEVG